MDDDGIRDIVEVDPAIVLEDLQARDVVGDENRYGRHVGVCHHSESYVGPRTRRVIVDLHKKA